MVLGRTLHTPRSNPRREMVPSSPLPSTKQLRVQLCCTTVVLRHSLQHVEYDNLRIKFLTSKNTTNRKRTKVQEKDRHLRKCFPSQGQGIGELVVVTLDEALRQGRGGSVSEPKKSGPGSEHTQGEILCLVASLPPPLSLPCKINRVTAFHAPLRFMEDLI